MDKDINLLLSDLHKVFHDTRNALEDFRTSIDDNIYDIALSDINTHEYHSQIISTYTKFGVRYSRLTEMILDIRTLKKLIEQNILQQSLRTQYLSQIVGLENSVSVLRDAYEKLKPTFDARIKYLQYSQYLVSSMKTTL